MTCMSKRITERIYDGEIDSWIKVGIFEIPPPEVCGRQDSLSVHFLMNNLYWIDMYRLKCFLMDGQNNSGQTWKHELNNKLFLWTSRENLDGWQLFLMGTPNNFVSAERAYGRTAEVFFMDGQKDSGPAWTDNLVSAIRILYRLALSVFILLYAWCLVDIMLEVYRITITFINPFCIKIHRPSNSFFFIYISFILWI